MVTIEIMTIKLYCTIACDPHIHVFNHTQCINKAKKASTGNIRKANVSSQLKAHRDKYTHVAFALTGFSLRVPNDFLLLSQIVTMLSRMLNNQT